MKSYNLVIVSTGSEITNGKSQDTNSTWIANELSGLGIKVSKFIALPDEFSILRNEITQLAGNNEDPNFHNWIIMTGGLGPTDDDLTVDVLLKINNLQPKIVEKARLKLEAIYKSRGYNYDKILDTVIRQTRIPEGARILDNKVGIAPGFILELSDSCSIACMPGVPAEMKEMFSRRLLPILRESIQPSVLYRGEKILWDMGESLYQEKFARMHPIVQSGRVEWGVTAKRGYIKCTFLSSIQSDIDTILKDLEQTFGDQCSDEIFLALHNFLMNSNKKLAIAESCTGGLLGKLITDFPGSSKYFISSLVTYSNSAKENLLFVNPETILNKGAVSPETAIEMVNGLEKHFNLDYAVSITGIAGPDGGSSDKPVGLVYIGIKTKSNKPKVFEYRFPGNREAVRESSASNALYCLYKEIVL
jgi:nicotinamide-nucleotide amidase